LVGSVAYANPSAAVSLSLSLSLISKASPSGSRCTRGEKGALQHSRSREFHGGGELASVSSGGVARGPYFPAIGGGVPHRRVHCPHQPNVQAVSTSAVLFAPRAILFVAPPLLWRPPVLAPCRSCGRSSLPGSMTTPPPWDYSELWTRPRSPWPVGGQAGVRESSSVAAHMHATASDRCTTSHRRRNRSYRNVVTRRAISRSREVCLGSRYARKVRRQVSG